MEKSKVLSYLKTFLIYVAGATIAAAGSTIFYLPNKIVGGGVSGISTMLYHFTSIPPGVSFAVINVTLLLIGWKILGTKFVVKTGICSGIFSIMAQVFTVVPTVTDDIVLATIFGSILYGFGLGVIFAVGASSGGTDILGRILQYFMPHMPIGKLLLVVDGIIIGVSLVLFGKIDLALYGVIALLISTFVIDFLIRKLNVSKLAFIISEKGDEIATKLVHTSPRGITKIDAVGAYTGKEKKMLVAALKSGEIESFQKKILEIDPKAFIIFAESQQIVGKGFHVYR